MSQVMLQPVLFGGLFMGVLSALPIISIGNCCCLWVFGGGMVTAYLTQHGKPDPIQLGDGALGGFLSGVVGAVVFAVVALPIQLLTAPLQRGLMDGLLESAADVPPGAWPACCATALVPPYGSSRSPWSSTARGGPPITACNPTSGNRS